MLLLDLAGGEILAPDANDAVALRAIPEWARPLVEAALEVAGG